jgi:hypothetical protein
MTVSVSGAMMQGKHMKNRSTTGFVALYQSGKTHEKPLYDGLRSALPVGANVVI